MVAKRILVVDDDENILNLEKTILGQKGFEVTGAAAGGAVAVSPRVDSRVIASTRFTVRVTSGETSGRTTLRADRRAIATPKGRSSCKTRTVPA